MGHVKHRYQKKKKKKKKRKNKIEAHEIQVPVHFTRTLKTPFVLL